MEYTKNGKAAEVIGRHYGKTPLAYVRSFGCQQSVNDGESLKGVLCDVGYALTDTPAEADLILFNTCAVREHAEQRVYGNLGALKPLKQARPGLLIGLCGCMPQQKCTVEKLRASYPYVDMILGTNAAHVLPEAIVEKLTTRKKALRLPNVQPEVVEGIPQIRESGVKAFLPIMYGCDNYCSYCIVPYVRGGERSREARAIREEFRALVAAGYKEITLLGQNVNSYGKGLEEKIDFSDLLQVLCQTEGKYKLRFMTSHPKDATRKMVDTLLEHDALCNHLHLPVQSGSNEILARMNRKYTVEDYLGLVRYAREKNPDITFSSDIMVGFPGETEEDFEKTLELVRQVGFTQLFTFIYSKRQGTQAAELPDELDHKQKTGRLERLTNLQEEMAVKLAGPWVGRRFEALVEGPGRHDDQMVARLDNNMLVELAQDTALYGQFVQVEVQEVRAAMLKGKIVK